MKDSRFRISNVPKMHTAQVPGDEPFAVVGKVLLVIVRLDFISDLSNIIDSRSPRLCYPRSALSEKGHDNNERARDNST